MIWLSNQLYIAELGALHRLCSTSFQLFFFLLFLFLFFFFLLSFPFFLKMKLTLSCVFSTLFLTSSLFCLIFFFFFTFVFWFFILLLSETFDTLNLSKESKKRLEAGKRGGIRRKWEGRKEEGEGERRRRRRKP